MYRFCEELLNDVELIGDFILDLDFVEVIGIGWKDGKFVIS